MLRVEGNLEPGVSRSSTMEVRISSYSHRNRVAPGGRDRSARGMIWLFFGTCEAPDNGPLDVEAMAQYSDPIAAYHANTNP
jgi:hypothetical protein